jgi:hypothetical protein
MTDEWVNLRNGTQFKVADPVSKSEVPNTNMRIGDGSLRPFSAGSNKSGSIEFLHTNLDPSPKSMQKLSLNVMREAAEIGHIDLDSSLGGRDSP